MARNKAIPRRQNAIKVIIVFYTSDSIKKENVLSRYILLGNSKYFNKDNNLYLIIEVFNGDVIIFPIQ